MASIAAIGGLSPTRIASARADGRQSVLSLVPWRWTDALLGLTPLALTAVGVALLGPSSYPVAVRRLWLTTAILALPWMLAYPLQVARRSVGWPRPARLGAIAAEALVALIALLGTILVMSAVFTTLTHFFGDSARPGAPLEPLARSPHRVESLAFLVLALAVSPVVEEVFFRGLIYNWLRQRLRPTIAVPLQAAVFALSHPFGPADRVAVALVGVALAVVYEWRKTLLAPMLLHLLLNALSIALLAWGLAGPVGGP